MKVYNAKISDVTVGLNTDLSERYEYHNCLSARMNFKFDYGNEKLEFFLPNLNDVQRLTKLMKYTDSYDVKELEGKIVRLVIVNGYVGGFGDPIEDKFIPVCIYEFVEVTEKEFEEKYETK